MDLQVIWFLLIGILFAVFFVLEGFDYGVAMLAPFLGTNDRERNLILSTIHPVWDGNEVWLLTAGGAMFAAFPHWYATLFSAFYIPFVVLLLALIARVAGIEFRNKAEDSRWRFTWDIVAAVSSLVPSIAFGVVFANIIRGIAIDGRMTFVGNWLDLVNAWSLLGGITTLALFLFQGATFLCFKTEGVLQERAWHTARRIAPAATMLLVLFLTAGMLSVPAFLRHREALIVIFGLAFLAASTSGRILRRKPSRYAFFLSSTAILLFGAGLFTALFPYVIISSLNFRWSIALEKAASSPYTLNIMTWVALFFVPIVIAYQGWSYWIFRKRISFEQNTNQDIVY